MNSGKKAQRPSDKNKAETNRTLLTDLLTNPLGSAALTIQHIFRPEELPLAKLLEELMRQQKSICEGNSHLLESLLINQMQSLQALFTYASIRASKSETIPQWQVYTDVAIKVNNACRKTILAINQLKNPAPATFIKQQNNSVNQQINNGQPVPEKNKKSANELLIEEKENETLDFRRTSEAIRAHPAMETVEIGRRKDT
ncbi:MAG: hypothetical protein A2X77_04405 [Gammaproteobacteria bacterium GWE2_42_36]|nr:MAG: hypothetical protein A2X77_04405 [Gammaproteobacteria bacterium GWE2_42_36]